MKNLKAADFVETLTKKQKSAVKSNITRALKLLNGGKNWVKEAYDDGNQNYCMVGAIRKANGPGERATEQLLSRLINFHYSIESFNDADNRRFRDVEAKFNQALKLLA